MAIDFSLSPELEEIRTRIRVFIDDVVKPGEALIEGHGDNEPQEGKERIDTLISMRKQAFSEGLWLPPLADGVVQRVLPPIKTRNGIWGWGERGGSTGLHP